ncbi:MAG: RNA-binding protein [Frankiales bacterium]|nr:RNA-binding protein [Frankiales bacterium]
MLEEALEHLVKGIVDHPEDVDVRDRASRRGPGRALEVRVHPDDMGRVIGKSGRTATALRTVLSALSSGKNVRVDFLDLGER